MAKDAAIGMRVDGELKERAGKVFDEMGLPMSLGIELFLKQVAEKGKLPFSLAADDGQDPEREKRERDFWRSFMVWYFDAWPFFDSKEAEKRAVAEFDYDPHKAPGTAIQRLIDCDGAPSEDDKRAASRDLHELRSLVHDAKELIYWALGMDKLFVPSLSARYDAELDAWRLRHLKIKSRDRFYFGMREDDLLLTRMEDLSDDELMEFFDEWLMEGTDDENVERLLMAVAENATDFDQVRQALEAVNLYDDFEDYVEGELAERGEE